MIYFHFLKNRRPKVAAAALVAVLGLSSCAAAETASEGGTNDDDLTSITVAEQSRAGLTTGGMIHLADHLGYFEEKV